MPETPTSLLANDAVLFGVLAVMLGFVFWTSESGHPFWKRFYAIFPPLLLAYFLPSLLTTFGLVDPEQSQLYFVASRYLMPAALVLLTAVADLPGTLKLGPKALIMFFTGTLSVMLGGTLAIYVASLLAPDVVAETGPDAMWRGMATVAGSWIGGSPNQTALREIFGAGADTFAIWVAVDVLVASVWLAMMLWVAANQNMVDRWLKADVTALDAVKQRAQDYETEHARIPSLRDFIVIVAVGFGATGLSHYAADWLTPYFQTNFPEGAQFSVHSSFFWLIVVALLHAGAQAAGCRRKPHRLAVRLSAGGHGRTQHERDGAARFAVFLPHRRHLDGLPRHCHDRDGASHPRAELLPRRRQRSQYRRRRLRAGDRRRLPSLAHSRGRTAGRAGLYHRHVRRLGDRSGHAPHLGPVAP